MYIFVRYLGESNLGKVLQSVQWHNNKTHKKNAMATKYVYCTKPHVNFRAIGHSKLIATLF